MTTFTPTTQTFNGSDLTGSDGATSRTATLSSTNITEQGMQVTINGSSLIQGAGKDYTVSSGVLTFIINVFDADTIQVSYFVTSTSTSLGTAYATTLQVFEYLGLVKTQPEFVSGQSPSPEVVDSSGSLSSGDVIYLDKNRVIDDTYTLSHGADADNRTDLTETTDYTIDIDTGKITITATGATAIGSDNVYAEYKYNDLFTDSFISDLIDRKTQEIDRRTNRTWQTSNVVSDETHIGKGRDVRHYRVKNIPLLTVTKVEISNTPVGTTPTYTEIDVNDDYTVDLITGVITLIHSDITPDGLYLGVYPPLGVPDRFRVSYTYGSSAVNEDIIHLCVLMVSRTLVNSSMGGSLVNGTDGFTPTAQENMDMEIRDILNQNRMLLIDGF